MGSWFEKKAMTISMICSDGEGFLQVHDFRVEPSREFLAVRAGWPELGETQPSVNAAFAEEI